ncbi:unnamed protein product [Clonostachys solani]|uniref:Alcohol dehydrogenase-like C-terminal domain-containing protein n=1 Tax=Clonostachys solani TaxID=160281 RepID=A0A9P0EGU5_9HYPO|nr:unnamed protein product [Clonostachys solani]
MPSSYGTHQDLAVARSELLYKVPSNLSLKDASAICMAAHTSADALFNVIGLGFPAADVTGIDPTGRGILIWGGASSVGCMTIQIAKAAGFQHIFTTASLKNHSVLRQLGATHCFDYHSSSVVNDIQTTQKDLGIDLTMAFDTVGKGASGHGVTDGLSTPALTRSALDSSGFSKDIYLVCTLPVPADSAFKFCTSYRPNGDRNAIGAPQDPEAPIRIHTIMEHLLASTDGGLRLPVVTAVTGVEAGIEAIRRVAAGEVSMEKLVLKHPLE